jgi:HemY protein
MFRALWYFVKIVILLGGVIFLYAQPGSVVATWGDYTVTLRLGALAAGLFIALCLIIFVSDIVTRMVMWPKEFMRARRERQRIKGYRALLQSMTAAAIGDKKTAFYMAHRAEKLLPASESGLPILLKAQAQPEQGQPQAEMYNALLQNADTALLGLQGLTQQAILLGDFPKALSLVRKSVETYPKSTVLLKALYDMELKNYLWGDALITLKRAEKAKVITKRDAAHDRTALYCLLGDMAAEAKRPDEAMESYKLATDFAGDFFAPAFTRLAKQYMVAGKDGKALAILEKAWRKNPHPDFLDAWSDAFTAASDKQKKLGKHGWMHVLTKTHPDLPESHLALARAAIEDGLWGEAKTALALAEKSGPRADIYHLWVDLETKTTNRAEVMRQWVDRAYNAPKGWQWVCVRTGRTYHDWVGVVEPERLFNTLVWRKDEAVLNVPALTQTQSNELLAG